MATHRPIRGLLHRLDHPLALGRWEMSRLPIRDLGHIPPITRQERERARRAVAAHALDPTDAAIMLAALGLDKEDN